MHCGMKQKQQKNSKFNDMNKLLFFPLAIVAMFSIIACEEKKAAQSYSDDEEAYENVMRDSMLYGVCAEGSAMHTLQLITGNGDTLTLSTIPAQEAEKVFGGFAIGDHMAVLTNAERTQATMIVNMTTLLGNWVMPNPMDGSSEMGICIRDGGIAESINQTAIIYETWRLINGMLELMSVRDDGGDYEEVERYQILYLSSDSLAYCNEEDTYEYSRPHPEENYDGLGIEFDDEAEEDMQMVM